jgi:hypothetical protein
MKKLLLVSSLILLSSAIYAQRIALSLQAGYVFNTALRDKTMNTNPLNRGLSLSLQGHYRLPMNFEVGPLLEIGAVETMGGITGTAGVIANKKIDLGKAKAFAGAMGGYIFGNESGIKTNGYTYGLHAGWNIPLGKRASLYMSAGARYAMQESTFYYEKAMGLPTVDKTESITFPVLVGVRVGL